MKYCIFFLLLNFSLFGFSFAEANRPDESSSQFDHPELSVWRVDIDFINSPPSSGTGFFVGEKHFITNFHVVSGLLQEQEGENIEGIFLSQEGNNTFLGIKKLLAVSALYDLALFETEEPAVNFLNLGEQPTKSDENLFIIAYPARTLTKIRKMGDINYEDEISYAFPTDHSDIDGASGGPVLDRQGQVLGVLYSSHQNILEIIKLNHLREFIAGNVGTKCIDSGLNRSSDIKTCMRKEADHLEELAEAGDFYAQFQLAHIHFYKARVFMEEFMEEDFEKALYWMEKAAEQAYSPAQYNLARILEIEGTFEQYEEVFKWMKKAAEQGYPSAQWALSKMYEEGEVVPYSYQEALKWIEKAGKQGYSLASQGLANIYVRMYEEGQEVKKNFGEAFRWHKIAMEQGLTDSEAWFIKLAEQGHAKAQYELALYYERRREISNTSLRTLDTIETSTDESHEDLSKTYYWLIEASRQVYAPALSKLTDMVCNAKGDERDINKAVIALKEIKETFEQEISNIQNCLDQLREKGITIGTVALLAAVGAEQAYAQGSESTTEVAFHIEEKPTVQTGESVSGSNVGTETASSTSEIDADSVSQTAFEVGEESISQTAFEVDEGSVSRAMLEADAGSATQAEGMSSGINEEMVTEVSDVLGEVAADLALDWIPVVGFGKLGFEALIGVHVLTGRNLTTFERAASGGGAVLNLVGFGWLKNLKSLKHSKAVGQQANKWFSVYINGEQWAKFSRFVGEGQMGRARAYLTSVFQSIGEIGFKVKRRVTTRKKVLASGGSSVDEASETVVVNMEEGLGVPGRLESDKLSRAVDPDKLSNPGQSKVYRVGDVDQVPSARDGVFVRTPRGDQPLDYNNPEVLSWLRQAEVPQRQSVESLINRGTNRTVGSSSATPPSLIKTGIKESPEISDFDLVLH